MRTMLSRFAGPIFCVVLGTLLTVSAAAQIGGFHGNGISSRGVPASVTSFGFGGHPGFHGVPASVTSQGFGARNNFRGVPGHGTSFGFAGRNGFRPPPFESGRRRIHRPFASYTPYYGGYYNYAPYSYPYYLNDDDYSDSASYESPTNDYPDYDYRNDDDRRVLDDDYRASLSASREQSSLRSPQPVVAQPSTVLVFKDGHQQEISNYAIVGSTLYDLSDGRSKKVQLADLDVSATVKENDERGVEFQLPAQAQLN
jgi:hypothetical protein